MFLRRKVYPNGLSHFWLIDFSLLNLIKVVQAMSLPSEYCLIIRETSLPWSLCWNKTLKTPTPKKTRKQRPRRLLTTPILSEDCPFWPILHPTQAWRTMQFFPRSGLELQSVIQEPLRVSEPRPCCSTVLFPSWSCDHPPVSRNFFFCIAADFFSWWPKQHPGLTLPTSFIFWGH